MSESKLINKRQVIGEDIIRIQEELGLSTLEASYLLGVYPSKLGRLTSEDKTNNDGKAEGQHAPINDPTRSLLIRVLTEQPEISPVKPPPTPQALFAEIQKVDESYKARWLGPLLGCEMGAGYRWFGGTGFSPVVGRYIAIIMDQLAAAKKEDRPKVLRYFELLAEREATSRGVLPDDLWKKGTWSHQD